MAAKRELARTELSGRVARVIVLSDGRPTEGDRRTSTLVAHSEALRALGATSSTVGLGLDYNEDLMEQLAVVGGGRYHYLKTGDEMGRILDAELHHGRNVVASRVTLHLDRALAPGLSILEVPGQLDRGAGHKVHIDLGDLAAGEERHVLVKVAVDAAAVLADGVGFAAPELVYRQAGTQTESLVAHRADAFRLLPSTDLAAVNESRIDAVRIPGDQRVSVRARPRDLRRRIRHVESFVDSLLIRSDAVDVALDALEPLPTLDGVYVPPHALATVLRRAAHMNGGPAALRPLFVAMFEEFALPGVTFELLARRVEGECAYIAWRAETPRRSYTLGADTFIVRGGRIVYQTSAIASSPKA
jgi:hypothetical protein